MKKQNKPDDARTMKTAARIATQFGRQTPSQAIRIEAIADDALRLAELGHMTREQLLKKRRVAKLVQEAAAIAERYGAALVDHRDLRGMVMGLKFPPGQYVCGVRDWFYVA